MTEPPAFPVGNRDLSGPIRMLAAIGTDFSYPQVSWNRDGDMLMAKNSHRGAFVQIFQPATRGNGVEHADLKIELDAESAVWSRSHPRRLYVSSPSKLYCIDLDDGSKSWQADPPEGEPEADQLLIPGQTTACLTIDDDEVIASLFASSSKVAVYSHGGAFRETIADSETYVVAAHRTPAVLTESSSGVATRHDLRTGDSAGFATAGNAVFWATWSRNDTVVAMARSDGSVTICDGRTLALIANLEGHSSNTFALAFSHDDRLLASMSSDRTVRLWRTDSWQCVAVLSDTPELGFGGLAFHPERDILACRGDSNKKIVLLRYDLDELMRRPTTARRYLNAKVVLVGDSGVGKSGLGLLLGGQQYRPTESTHGRQVASANIEEIRTADGTVETREIMLWDLAGQPGYRIVHQLHLPQAAVAVLVFDPKNEADPLPGVRYWHRAINNTERLRADGPAQIPTVLVAGRVDRGGVPLPRRAIDGLVEEMRFAGFVETSAKEGWGIEELRRLILNAIPWDRLPWSASTELFDRIKVYLWQEKNAGRVLATTDDLLRGFLHRHADAGGSETLRPSFTTCVRLLEGRDVLRRLTFGDYVLLRPEALDAYASALIDAARTEPDGLGFVPESDALTGKFRMPSDERLTDAGEENVLLIATVEELLRHDLVLREVTDTVDLVFPSQFTRDRPEAPDRPTLEVTLAFEGAVHSIYAALAVRLSHIGLYRRTGMYRNTATFTAKVGGACGISLTEISEGRAELGLFFTGPASEETRYLFEDYVRAHVEQRATSVERRRVYRCPDEGCGYELPRDLVERWQQRKRKAGPCPACLDREISLLDREARLSAAVSAQVSTMNDRADRQRDLAVAETTIKGKAATNTFDVFISYRTGDRDEAEQMATNLLRRGIRPWLDIWEIAPGQRWQDVLETQISSIRSVAVLIGDRGLGPWQDHELKTFISQFMRRRCRVIPVFLASAGPDTVLPPLLAEWHAADFRTARPDPVSQLIRGITGEFPQEAQ